MTQDEALKQAGDILIKVFPDLYGSINYNMQGPRRDVMPKVTRKILVRCMYCHEEFTTEVDIPVEIIENKRL